MDDKSSRFDANCISQVILIKLLFLMHPMYVISPNTQQKKTRAFTKWFAFWQVSRKEFRISTVITACWNTITHSIIPRLYSELKRCQMYGTKKKSTKTSAFVASNSERWQNSDSLPRAGKKKKKLFRSNHWRQKAKRTATTNYFTLADRRTKSKSVGFSVSFKQACNPTGSESERSPKQKPQSTDSDRRASSR